MPLASANPDSRIDDLKHLAATALRRLAREQDAAVPGLKSLSPKRRQRTAATGAAARGEAARAVAHLVEGCTSSAEQAEVVALCVALLGADVIPSVTLTAWADALEAAS